MVARTKARRVLLAVLGSLALALGILGVVLPVLPTTPFVLVAGTCFAGSSPRMYRWLWRNRLFGPYLQNYRDHVGLSVPRKVLTIAFLWAGLITSSVLIDRAWFWAVAATIATGVTIHLLLIKTRHAGGRPTEGQAAAGQPMEDRPMEERPAEARPARAATRR